LKEYIYFFLFSFIILKEKRTIKKILLDIFYTGIKDLKEAPFFKKNQSGSEGKQRKVKV